LQAYAAGAETIFKVGSWIHEQISWEKRREKLVKAAQEKSV